MSESSALDQAMPFGIISNRVEWGRGMMRYGILAVICLVLTSDLSQADTIKCTFTEPFIDTSYDLGRETMTINEDEGRKSVLNKLSFHVLNAGLFEIRDVRGRVIQKLELSFKGTNSMNNDIYPYDVRWISRDLRGGCVSDHLLLQEEQFVRAPNNTSGITKPVAKTTSPSSPTPAPSIDFAQRAQPETPAQISARIQEEVAAYARQKGETVDEFSRRINSSPSNIEAFVSASEKGGASAKEAISGLENFSVALKNPDKRTLLRCMGVKLTTDQNEYMPLVSECEAAQRRVNAR